MGWHHSICRISLPDVQLLDLALDQNNHFNSWSYPFTRRKTLANRAFSSMAPRWWNELPTDIKKSQDIHCFKAKLKTHIFKQYYRC